MNADYRNRLRLRLEQTYPTTSDNMIIDLNNNVQRSMDRKDPSPSKSDHDRAIQAALQWGVYQKFLKRAIERFGVDYVVKEINYVARKEGVRNRSAYLVKTLKSYW